MKIRSKIITSLIVFFTISVLLVTYVYFSKDAAKVYSVGTALTNVINTVTDTQVSATTSHKIDFTTYTDVPTEIYSVK